MSATVAVLDSSAVLAWLKQEPGWEAVRDALSGSAISAANWSEILQKALQWKRDAEEVGSLLKQRGVVVEPVSEEDGFVAAQLWERASHLFLGDRLCLALARRLGRPALTAESHWDQPAVTGAGCTVQLIR